MGEKEERGEEDRCFRSKGAVARNKRTDKCQAGTIFTDWQDKSGRLTTLKKINLVGTAQVIKQIYFHLENIKCLV